MPSRRKSGKNNGRRKPSSNPISKCNLPHDIIVNILSRLPVQTLLRFRSVCKPWRTLIRNHKFVSAHLAASAQNHLYRSLIIHSFHRRSSDHIVSLFNPNTNPHNPVNLLHPFPYFYLEMNIVGSINGLICLNKPPWGDVIHIWNPAINSSFSVKLSGTKPLVNFNSMVSIGFGFDSKINDYKVISIICFKPGMGFSDMVELYSTNSGYWKRTKASLSFRILGTTCDAIVKGVPYWRAITEDVFGSREIFVWFDLQNEVFGLLGKPLFCENRGTQARLIDLSNSLALIVYSPGEELNQCVDLWVMDDDDCSWTKKLNVGPILGVHRLVGCLGNMEIVAENEEGKLFLYDGKNRGIEVVSIDEAVAGSFHVFNYIESLVSIRGMKQVERRELQTISTSMETLWRMGFNIKVSHGADGQVYLGCTTGGGDFEPFAEFNLPS